MTPTIEIINAVSLDTLFENKSVYNRRLQLLNSIINNVSKAVDNDSIQWYLSQSYLHGIWEELNEHMTIDKCSDGMHIYELLGCDKYKQLLLIKWLY